MASLLSYQIPQLIEADVVASVSASAQETDAQFKILRKYFVQDVLSNVAGKSDASVAIEHAGKERAIPLPATMLQRKPFQWWVPNSITLLA
jgi:hypothetical protein